MHPAPEGPTLRLQDPRTPPRPPASTRPRGIFRFRCQSRSSPFEHYWIEVREDSPGQFAHLCSCGLSYCSHVDAVLRCGELAMVWPDDLLEAAAAHMQVRAFIVPPPGWRATWRHDRRWRRLPLRRQPVPLSLRPSVHFHAQWPGMSGPSPHALQQHAQQRGWQIHQDLQPDTTVLVTDQTDLFCEWLNASRTHNSHTLQPTILDYDQWLLWEEDIYRICMARLSQHQQPA